GSRNRVIVRKAQHPVEEVRVNQEEARHNKVQEPVEDAETTARSIKKKYRKKSNKPRPNFLVEVARVKGPKPNTAGKKGSFMLNRWAPRRERITNYRSLNLSA